MKPEELLEHAHFVHRLALRLVSDEHRAADIEQQTWVAALEHPPGSSGSMRGWLARVATNFKHRFLQIDSRRTRREKLAAPPERTLSTDELVERAEIRQRVVEAVLRLDDPYRSVLLLRYYEDLSPQEIARNQGVPVETVRTRLKRGLARLQHALDAAHGGSRQDWLLALAPIAGLKLEAAVAGTVASASANLSLGGLFMALKAKTALLCLGAVSVVVVLGVFLVGSLLSTSSDPQHSSAVGQAAHLQGGSQETVLSGWKFRNLNLQLLAFASGTRRTARRALI
jgi:RNA polymerase sigma factor (sigma-70 family)